MIFTNSKWGFIVGGGSGSLTSAKFNNCVFNENQFYGIYGANKAKIHLHGEATAIHSNGDIGIQAHGSAKVLIHLPSNHNTSYNNGGQDRYTSSGGTITTNI